MKRRAVLARVAIGLAFLAGAGGLTAVPAIGDEQARRPARFSFVSGGKMILVDEYEPTEAGNHPSALVLHGAGGMLFDGPEMRRMAMQLAAGGVRAYVVHYFDGSGVVFTTSDRVLQAHFDAWLAVVRDAVNFACEKQEAGEYGQPIGIYGYSMGAFLGIAVSSDNRNVAALAEQAGGIWNHQLRLGRMPVVLMIHGRADRRVPFGKYALPLEAALKQRGTSPATLFIDGEGHGFSAAAQAKARTAATAFLQREIPEENGLHGTEYPAISAGKKRIGEN